jgi:hypothetical protein
MRSAVLHLAEVPSSADRRAALRTAVRQLERAELYLAAVVAMELADRDASRALIRLRGDVDALRHHLLDLRAQT